MFRLTRAVREALFALFYLSGLPFLLRHLYQRRYATVVCYHDPTAKTLDLHLRLLARRYRLVSLADIVAWQRGERSLPRFALALTFDDGHRGNAHLPPVLHAHAAPATLFACSAIVGTRRGFWFRHAFPRDQLAKLKRCSDETRRQLLAGWGFSDTEEIEPRQALSDEELRSWTEPPLAIGSHTRFHPVLPMCTPAVAGSEIAGSRRELEERFGLRTEAFAFPNGDYSDRDLALVERAGYRCAVTLDPGYNGRDTSPYRLRRLPVADNAGCFELLVKASGLWALLRAWLAPPEYGQFPVAARDSHSEPIPNPARRVE